MESRWIHGVHVESMWNLWGRVKYSPTPQKRKLPTSYFGVSTYDDASPPNPYIDSFIQQVQHYSLTRGTNSSANSIQAPPSNLCLQDKHIIHGVVAPRNWQWRVKPKGIWGVLIYARWKGEEDSGAWGMSACSIFDLCGHWTASTHLSLSHIFAIHGSDHVVNNDIFPNCHMASAHLSHLPCIFAICMHSNILLSCYTLISASSHASSLSTRLTTSHIATSCWTCIFALGNLLNLVSSVE